MPVVVSKEKNIHYFDINIETFMDGEKRNYI